MYNITKRSNRLAEPAIEMIDVLFMLASLGQRPAIGSGSYNKQCLIFYKHIEIFRVALVHYTLLRPPS